MAFLFYCCNFNICFHLSTQDIDNPVNLWCFLESRKLVKGFLFLFTFLVCCHVSKMIDKLFKAPLHLFFWQISELIASAFSNNLSAENSKVSADPGIQRIQLLEFMWDTWLNLNVGVDTLTIRNLTTSVEIRLKTT